MTDTTNTLLLNLLEQVGDLREQVGEANARLEAGAKTHKEFRETLQMIDRRSDITEDKVVAIEAVLNPADEPSLLKRVANLEAFNGKIGVIISFGSIVLWGVAYFIWNTLNWVWAHLDVKNVFKGLWH